VTSPSTEHFENIFKTYSTKTDGQKPATSFELRLLNGLGLDTYNLRSGAKKADFTWSSSSGSEVSEGELESGTYDQDSFQGKFESEIEQIVCERVPVVCCPYCSIYLGDKKPFVLFSACVESGVATSPSTSIDTSFVNHVMELVSDPQIEDMSEAQTPSQFFACMNPTLEYREVPSSFFDLYQEQKEAEFKVRCWFTCPEHKKAYQLLRYDHSVEVKVGYGLKKRELTPREVAREKRMFLIKKISYGMEVC
jgi:hypothetical protein